MGARALGRALTTARQAGSALAICMHALGIRADFESGPLTLEQLYNVFPFDNTITTQFLS